MFPHDLRHAATRLDHQAPEKQQADIDVQRRQRLRQRGQDDKKMSHIEKRWDGKERKKDRDKQGVMAAVAVVVSQATSKPKPINSLAPLAVLRLLTKMMMMMGR